MIFWNDKFEEVKKKVIEKRIHQNCAKQRCNKKETNFIQNEKTKKIILKKQNVMLLFVCLLNFKFYEVKKMNGY